MNKRIPIGIVGLNFGRHIIDELTVGPASSYFEIVAVCDLDASKAQNMAQRLGVCAYTDFDEFLKATDFMAVGLFTGPIGRASLIQRLIKEGKDVITTKPFEKDPQAALDVLIEAQKLGRIIHLNSPSPLLSPDLVQIRTWHKEFDLGKPVGARADIWASYREQADGTWYDDPELCPVAPIFRLGIYLINDLIQIFGPAQKVQVLESRLFEGRPTPDNAQLGILFKNGGLANIFASFCVNDGDHYRNSLTLNFENGTIYRNVGADRAVQEEISLIMNKDGKRSLVAQVEVPSQNRSGHYQWDAFARAIRGEKLDEVCTPEEIVAGLQVIQAMAQADGGEPIKDVKTIELRQT
jgi:predicted dehydrogenase